jgi:hypothetical protein
MNAGAALDVTNLAEILARYRQARSVSMPLNTKLAHQISKRALDQGGKNLGILKGGTLVFDIEDEVAVLMDHCIYDLCDGGRNAVDQYLLDSPPPVDSPEMACLRAMQRAWYSLFCVEVRHSGYGLTVRDVISDKVYFLADQGFSLTGVPGMLMATRLVPRDGFAMTTGAALPIGVVPKEQLPAMQKEILRGIKIDAEGKFAPAPLIRECLKRGLANTVAYRSPGESPPDRIIANPGKISRNDPCPCGSGKKFKKCCLNQD